jgi:hypothetical protein
MCRSLFSFLLPHRQRHRRNIRKEATQQPNSQPSLRQNKMQQREMHEDKCMHRRALSLLQHPSKRFSLRTNMWANSLAKRECSVVCTSNIHAPNTQRFQLLRPGICIFTTAGRSTPGNLKERQRHTARARKRAAFITTAASHGAKSVSYRGCAASRASGECGDQSWRCL